MVEVAELEDKARRERSKIEFAYSDLDNAVELSRTVRDRGGGSCDVAQLAVWLDQTATGGTFRSRLGAARLFDLVDMQQGRVSLTSLGRDALDDAKGPIAKAEAFLRVPLHAAMYDKYNGYALPPAPGLEAQLVQLGIPTKQKERARQTFLKSAQQAGYIDPQNGRFVKPAHAAPLVSIVEAKPTLPPPGFGHVEALNLDPLLMALLKKIPATGEQWPSEQRLRWFRTFAMNVSQIYDTSNDAVDLDIHLQDNR